MRLPPSLSAFLIAALLAASGCKHSDASDLNAAEIVMFKKRMRKVKAAKTINYYPATHGWSKMWQQFETLNKDKIFEADIATASDELGATNMRIIIFPYEFSFPKPPTESQINLLREFIKLCEAQRMTVSFTLFDWWGEFDKKAESLAWAQGIIEPFKNNKTLINVELQNEFPAHGYKYGPTQEKPEWKKRPEAFTWANMMVAELSRLYPNMPLTFSVNSMENFKALREEVTGLHYYDYHYYESGPLSYVLLNEAKKLGSDKPMVIGESGLSTYKYTEGQQAAFFASLMHATSALDLNSLAVWALYDFTPDAIDKDKEVAKKPEQYKYGVFRTDKSPKKAVEWIHSAWKLGVKPASNDVLDVGFDHDEKINPWMRFPLPPADKSKPDVPADALPQRDFEHGNTKKGSIKFTNTAGAGRPISIRAAPVEVVKPGDTWEASVFAMESPEANGITRLKLVWSNRLRQGLPGTVTAVLPAGSKTWTQLQVKGIAPEGVAFLEVHLESENNKEGSVWFDDISITPPQ